VSYVLVERLALFLLDLHQVHASTRAPAKLLVNCAFS
jgi:hypothetical protein